MRRLISALLILCLFLAVSPVALSAAGEIEISTVEQLMKIGRDPAYPLNGNYLLTSDLDLKGHVWYPIGNPDGRETKSFSGTFDGGGHRISNMTSGSEKKALCHTDDGWGMFASLSGTVRNLILENTYFNVYAEYDLSDGVPEGYNGVGAVAGYIGNGALIEKIAVVNATVSDLGSRQSRVGGIVGSVSGSGGTVRDCLFYGTVLGSFGYIDKLDNFNTRCAVGGIIGSATDRGTAERCLVVGTVSLNGGYGFAHPIVASYQDFTSGATLKDCFYKVDLDVDPHGSLGKVKGGASEVSDEDLFGGSFQKLGSEWISTKGMLPHPVDGVAICSTELKDVADLLTGAFSEFTVTNYTTEQHLVDFAQEILDGSFTVSLSDSFRRIKASDKAGEISCTLKISSDAGSVPVPLKLAIPPVPEMTYTFSSSVKGNAQGGLVVKFATKDFVPHTVRWGTAEGAFENFSPITSFDDNGKTVRLAILRNTLIPKSATHLWLYRNGMPVLSLEIPPERRLTVSEPKYVFGVVSDLHLDNSNATVAVDGMLRQYAADHVDFMVSLGDNTSSNAVDQLTNWKTLKLKYPTLDMYSVLGNHDILPRHTAGNGLTTYTESEFRSLVAASLKRFQSYFENTVDYDYTLEQGDDLIIFLGLGTADEITESATRGGQALGQAQLDWLDETLDDYYNVKKKTGHVFLMFHFYARETFDTITTASALQVESSKKLEAVLAKYKDHEIIYFSGHNHYSFDVGMNIYDNHAGYTMIHCPSASKSANLKEKGHNLGREGFYVEVYDDYVIVRAHSFLRAENVSPACYLLSVGDSMTLSGATESVSGGGAISDSAVTPGGNVDTGTSDLSDSNGDSVAGSGALLPVLLICGLLVLLLGGGIVVFLVLKKK